MSVSDIPVTETAVEEIDSPVDIAESSEFEEGFTTKAVIGGIFIAFMMFPGALYLGLVAGQALGSAAQWVTIVLFAEIARRSFVQLKRQEIYIIFYIAGGLMAVSTAGVTTMAGGGFGTLIWNQFFIQSPQAEGMARLIPGWVVPGVGSHALASRTFMDMAWAVPIVLLVASEVLMRVSNVSIGYIFFRMTSDKERLPFPMAPVAVAGATALAESQQREESWRWRVFSIGGMIGLAFGFIYLALPIITGVLFRKPMTVLPIPFADFTQNTENVLPGALTGVSCDLTNVLMGFVLPFEIVAGMLISSILAQVVTNPILQTHGLLPTWRYGMGTIATQLSTSLDFWLSVSIGIQVAIAMIGIFSLVRAGVTARRVVRESRIAGESLPAGRGDFPIIYAVAVWGLATLAGVILCRHLVPLFPLWILLILGVVYSPVMGYVSARMYGITGGGVAIPFVREAAVFGSGYRGVDIAFAPIPLFPPVNGNYDPGLLSQRFKELELTRTRFRSLLKAEIFMLPVALIASFVWWSFFWRTSPVPSPQFPFAQVFWPMGAAMQSMWLSAYIDRGSSMLVHVLQPSLMVGAGISSVALYMVMSALRVPPLYFYGLAGGVGALPHSTIPMFLGAFLGRRYFARIFGLERWTSYAPVLLAGFSCGMGLMGMCSIAVAMILQSVNYLPY